MAATSAASRIKIPAEPADLGIRDLVDDVAGGFDEASGGIDLDQYSLIVAALGFVDGAGDVFLGDGLNGVVDDDLEDFSGGNRTQNKSCHEAKKNTRD